jgi:mannosyltransferase
LGATLAAPMFLPLLPSTRQRLDVSDAVYAHRRQMASGRWIAIGLCAIVALAAGLRIYALGEKSLWYDEALAHFMARRPLGNLWSETAAWDFHTPFYYGLLHVWMAIAGESEAGLRSLSVLLNVATVPIVYAIARLAAGRGPALLAALLFATMFLQVTYAQEARMYALMIFNSSLALWGAARIYQDMPTPPWLVRRDFAWAAYIVGAAGALWSHNTAVFLPLAINLAVIGRWLTERPKDWRLLGKWLAAQIAVLALWAPWLPSWLDQAAEVRRDFWLKTPEFDSLAAGADLLYQTVPSGNTWSGLGMLAVTVALASRAWRGERHWLYYFAAASFLPFAAEWLISQWTPVFLLRTLTWTQVPFVILLAAAWRALPGAVLKTIAVVALLASNGLGLSIYYTQIEKEPWRAIAADVAAAVEPGDGLVFVDSGAHAPFDYYFNPTGADLPRHSATPPFPAPRHLVLKPVDDADLAAIGAKIAGYKRVWVIWRDPKVYDPEFKVAAEIARRGSREYERAYQRHLIVQRYAITNR